MDQNETTGESTNRRRVVDLLGQFHTFQSGRHRQAVSELQSLDKPSTVDILRSLLAEGDTDLRCDAAEALMRIDAANAQALILPLLDDPDSTVRWGICGLLYDLGDERATAQLVNVLLHDSDGDVRFFAANALGNVSGASAIPSLRHAAEFDKGQDYEGRRVADAAAGAINNIQKRSSGI